MTKIDLRQKVKNGLLLLDGAMGTQLFVRSVEISKGNDYLNIESPDVILEIQKAYLKAGSDCVITNTFGGNKYALDRHSLDRHGLGGQVREINTAGAEIARKAAGLERYVLGDIGPSGDFLEPLGTLKPEELQAAFVEQAKGLLDGGVDGFIIETMTALDEIEIAIEAVKEVCGGLPMFVSLAFDTAGDDFRTMMGVSVEAAIDKIISHGVDGIGFNCGKVSLEGYVKLAEKFAAVVKERGLDVALLAEPNAGLPDLVDGETVYKVSGEEFAAVAETIHSLGFNIIGGCCGTCPEHIKAVREKLE